MFQRNKLVAHLFGVLCRFLQHFVRFTAQVRLSARYFRQRFRLSFCYERYLLPVHSQLLKKEIGDVLACFHYSQQKVCGVDSLLPPALRQIHGFLYRFLRFNGKIVEIHIFISPFFSIFNNTLQRSKDLPSGENCQYCIVNSRFKDRMARCNCLVMTKLHIF